MKFRTTFLILLVLTFSRTWAISTNINKEYLYTLLTEDYGILSDNDLAAYTWGKSPRSFDGKWSGSHNYWQCFPRDKISVTLEDLGHSSEDVGWKDTLANLTITVYATPNVIHEYSMNDLYLTSIYEKHFNLWHKIMKGEKYVCLAGNFVDIEKKTEDGKTKEIYGWIFDKIKTKKGCDSYIIDACYRTYEQLLQEEKGYKE